MVAEESSMKEEGLNRRRSEGEDEVMEEREQEMKRRGERDGVGHYSCL